MSIKTPQYRLPQVILSSGITVTELLTVRSDKELEQITAYSRAQIDVSHNFVLSLHIAIYQKGPQAVENPIQNLTAVGLPLKFVNYLANYQSVYPPPLTVFTLFNYTPIVLAGIVMVQLTQHV
ncbi:MAG: hypothetical protein EZS28_008825 [Streblomastix strix]|uniref:Uncharacterized protein n=1 Tax=Streblomastix strix TaxID=222440 RepID=A0A5J4WN41_9EUKA|nr:MAG: hypothetical protein EZS28_008825 [Streblomastix strix]